MAGATLGRMKDWVGGGRRVATTRRSAKLGPTDALGEEEPKRCLTVAPLILPSFLARGG